jgi:hypothetical protein
MQGLILSGWFVEALRTEHDTENRRPDVSKVRVRSNRQACARVLLFFVGKSSANRQLQTDPTRPAGPFDNQETYRLP